MTDDALQKNIRAADLIWAERQGGKHDGTFLPLWISHDLARKLCELSTGTHLSANMYKMPIGEKDSGSAMRDWITELKGPSAEWPVGLEIVRARDGSYLAKRNGRQYSE